MTDLDILRKTKEALDKAIAEKKISQEMLKSLSPAIIETLQPILQEIASNARITKEELLQVLSQIKVNVPEIKVPEANVKFDMPKFNIPESNVQVTVDEVKVPEIKTSGIEKTLRDVLGKFKLPEPKVTVNVPKFDKMEWPDGSMPIEGMVTLRGVDRKNPLPVELRNADGSPMNWPEYIGGSSGGRGIARIGSVDASAFASYQNSDGRLKVSVETGGSGLTDNELRASHLDVDQLSGSSWSVSVNDIFRTTVVSNLINSDDRLRVSLETGGSGLTDAELRTTAVPVSQLSGASWSVEATATNLDIRDLDFTTDDVSVYQVSGQAWSVSVNDIFRTTVASSLINSDDRLRVSLETGGSGLTDAELRATALQVLQFSGAIDSVKVTGFDTTVGATILDGDGVMKTTWLVSDITNSVKAALIDSSGVQYSGSNPVPIAIVSGALTSTIVVGSVVGDAVDDGSAPVQIGGIARTANPSVVAANDVVKATFDDVGRQLVRTVQVRDLIQTARASATNVTETTLLAGSASTFHDLIYILASNNSTGATAIDVRSGTANGVVLTLDIPANGVVGVSLPVPIPQDVAANAWTFQQQGDVSTTTVVVSALFSKEI